MNWKRLSLVSLFGCFAGPLFVVSCSGIVSSVHAQVTPEAFQGMIPAVPKDLCSATKEEKAAYLIQGN